MKIQLLSMPRSGHNAVMYWLAQQIEDRAIIYIHDAEGNPVVQQDYRQDKPLSLEIFNQEEKDLPSFNEEGSHILMVRDPLNWIASALKHIGHNQSIINRWIVNYLHYFDHIADYPVITYHRWFKDNIYRMDLCENLGLSFTDAGLNYVPPYAMGSSFDRTAFQGKGQLMQVLGRYKSFWNSAKFKRVFKDYPRLREIQDTFFHDLEYDKRIFND